MNISKITMTLVTVPFILAGIVFGLFYHSFCAGIMYSDILIEKSIKK